MRPLLLVALLPALLTGQSQSLVVRPTANPCLNIRRAPSGDSASLVCIASGSTVTADSSVPFWRRVLTADGTRGWAAKKFLDTTSGQPSTVSGQPSAIPDSAWLEIHIVDVGQGDGIWISTWDDGIPGNGRFDGRNIVIDGGPDGSDPKNQFLKYMQAHAHPGATIDALIVSHPHNDHYPGARGILSHFEVCHYYDPGIPNGSDFASFMAQVDSARCRGAPTAQHRGRQNFGTPDWGSEIGADFLWSGPIAATGFGTGGTKINNNSVVLRLSYGTQSFIFMGDAEGKERHQSPDSARYAEAGMLADTATARKLKSTLLKLAHHGSETSSTLPFIRAVDPEIIIVSSGRKAYSGTFLPDASTLNRYCANKPTTKIYRTDQNDAAEGRTTTTDTDGDHIVIRTNGQRTIVTALSAGQPFAAGNCAP